MDYQLIKLNTARNSLRYIVKALNINEIYVPYYICPAIRIALSKEDCKVKFYNIDLKFMPKYDFPKDAFVLYPNYFGICSKIVDDLAVKYPNLIVDNAHSFYSMPKGIASFNSLRKFFNRVRDGSFLYIKSIVNLDISQTDYFYENNLMTEEEFILNENRLDIEDIKQMSFSTNLYFNNLDLQQEKIKIKNRFNYYHREYAKINLLNIDIKKDDYPFKYPLLLESVDKAEKIVSDLKKQGVEIYRYWNNMPASFEEKVFYERLICI